MSEDREEGKDQNESNQVDSDAWASADSDTQEYMGAPVTRRIRRKNTVYCPFTISADIYSACSHKCVYCFSNNYGKDDRGRFLEFKREYKSDGVLRHFRSILQNKEIGLYGPIKNRMPIELSITTDAFQSGLELKQGASLEVVKFLNSIHYPFVVCTKASDTLSRPEYWDEMMTAHKDGKRVIFKISFSTFDDKLASLIEPGAPSPSARLAFIQRLTKAGIGVILRVQPMIMGHSYATLEKRIKDIKKCGAERVIIEPLRVAKLSFNQHMYKVFDAIGVNVKDYYAEYGDPSTTSGIGWIEYDPAVVRAEFIKYKTLLNGVGVQFSPSGLSYGWPNLDLADIKKYCCELAGYEHLHVDSNSLVVRWAEDRLDEIKVTMNDRTEFYTELERVAIVNNPLVRTYWKQQ